MNRSHYSGFYSRQSLWEQTQGLFVMSAELPEASDFPSALIKISGYHLRHRTLDFCLQNVCKGVILPTDNSDYNNRTS